jgi:hypothetical protein
VNRACKFELVKGSVGESPGLLVIDDDDDKLVTNRETPLSFCGMLTRAFENRLGAVAPATNDERAGHSSSPRPACKVEAIKGRVCAGRSGNNCDDDGDKGGDGMDDVLPKTFEGRACFDASVPTEAAEEAPAKEDSVCSDSFLPEAKWPEPAGMSSVLGSCTSRSP